MFGGGGERGRAGGEGPRPGRCGAGEVVVTLAGSMMCCAAPPPRSTARGAGRAGAEPKPGPPAAEAAQTAQKERRAAASAVDLSKQQVWGTDAALIFSMTLPSDGEDEMRFEEGGARVVRGEPAVTLSPVETSGGGSPPTALKKVRNAKRPGPPGGAGNRYRTAACNRPTDLLVSGTHFAEFALVKAKGNLTLGVAQLKYAPNRTAPPGTIRPKGEECWGLSTRSGSLTFRGKVSDWDGKCPIVQGDRVGMLVDMAEGRIAVFRNDKLLGFMVKAGLTGPLFWMAELSAHRDSVRIRRQSPEAYQNLVDEYLDKK